MCVKIFIRIFYFKQLFGSLTGNAAGRQTPPLIIFQGQRLPNQTKQILPNGWHANYSESGWMNSEIFYNYVSEIFYPWIIRNAIQTPVALFVDGHISHRSLKLSDFCSEHQIILVSFLPNTAYVCQPMDTISDGPLKQNWDSKLKMFRNLYRDYEKMTKSMFCEFLSRCVDESLSCECLQTAFAKTAIYPFNVNNIQFNG